MDHNSMKEIILLYIIKSLGAYVSAIKENEETEALAYYEGMIYGQLQIAVAQKIITNGDLTNIYITILDYKSKNYNTSLSIYKQ